MVRHSSPNNHGAAWSSISRMEEDIMAKQDKLAPVYGPRPPKGKKVKVYKLVGYYDIQFPKFAVTIPRPFKGTWKPRFRRRK